MSTSAEISASPSSRSTAGERIVVKPATYFDSVTLLRAARSAAAHDGDPYVMAAMATPLNLDLLRRRGVSLDDHGDLTPNDLVIVVQAADDTSADAIVARVEAALAAPDGASGAATATDSRPRSLRSALRRAPTSSIAVLSIPAEHVEVEAATALELGLNVFCFSDGVDIAVEKALKGRAAEQGLLFMGPDCGTTIVNGAAFGFANAVERGLVGIVGASGTGIQELTCLLDSVGIGISHAIGVGSHDLSDAVGGVMCRQALALLGADPSTQIIVVVSKPPDPAVAAEIAELCAGVPQPVVLALVGSDGGPAGADVVTTLEAAAARVARLAGRDEPRFAETLRRPPTPGFVRGLYTGGTLCTEAMSLLTGSLGRIASNIPLHPGWRLDDLSRSTGHTLLDFGEDELTDGRPHPMIDSTLRLERLARELRDPEVAVMLLDVILGYGSHPDPGGEIAEIVGETMARRDDLHVIVSLCGAAGDLQGLDRQAAALTAAGAVVTRSNAHAARLAVRAVTESGR